MVSRGSRGSVVEREVGWMVKGNLGDPRGDGSLLCLIVPVAASWLWDWAIVLGKEKGHMRTLFLISYNRRCIYNDLKIKALLFKNCQHLRRTYLHPCRSSLPCSPRCPMERFLWYKPGLWTWRSGPLRHPLHGWWHLWAATSHISRPFPSHHSIIREL